MTVATVRELLEDVDLDGDEVVIPVWVLWFCGPWGLS